MPDTAAADEDPMLPADRSSFLTSCGCDCRKFTSWRGSDGSRLLWKSVCSVILTAYMGLYTTIVIDSLALVVIGAVFLIKLQIEIWGQNTPTWACPGSPSLFVVVYVIGLPSLGYMFAFCRHADVHFPGRDVVGVLLNVFGSLYSLSYEVGRFRWKAKPENKGKLHTIGLAAYHIHPNYFGDLFTYTGWALAAGTQCALSVSPMSLFYLLLFVCQNSDSYLSQRYADEFPAYAAKTATLIPGLHNRTASAVVAFTGLFVSLYLQIQCGTACAM